MNASIVAHEHAEESVTNDTSMYGYFIQSTLEFAKKIHTERYIYGAYGFIDGLNLGLTIPKLAFGLYYFNSNLNYITEFHNFLASASGIESMLFGATLFICTSILGSFFTANDTELYRRKLAEAWPYIRDALKASKWGYKGDRGIFAVLEHFSGGIHPLLLPTGLLIATLAIPNRIWYRSMKNERIAMQGKNDKYTKITNGFHEDHFTLETWITYREEMLGKLSKQLQDQNYIKERGFLSAALAGVFEGPYFYFTAATLTLYLPPVFITMVVFSIFLTMAYVLSRVFEEYDYQRKLSATSIKSHIALCKQEINILLKYMQSELTEAEYQSRYIQLQGVVLNLVAKQKALEEKTRFSYLIAIMDGLKHGLATQGVLSSTMLAIVFVLPLFGLSCPPLFIVACVTVGVICVAYCVVSAILQHNEHLHRSPLSYGINKNLDTLITSIATRTDSQTNELIAEALRRDLVSPSNSDAAYFGVCEFLRQFFSGGIKGTKAWFELLPDNHYTTPILWAIIICTFLVACISSAGRALAKEFGSWPGEPAAEMTTAKSSSLSLFHPPNVDVLKQPENIVQGSNGNDCTFSIGNTP